MAEAKTKISYEKLNAIGSGGFGQVFMAKNKLSGEIYALKIIACKNDEELESAIDESKLMSQLVHANILRLLQIDTEQPVLFEANICLLFEYCPGGDLNARLRKQSSQALNHRWMKQLADGVAFMHSRNIVHRDIKPANILLTASDDIKIGDFGLSRKFMVTGSGNGTSNQHTSEQFYMESILGTPCFFAPEVHGGHYTEKADIFSLGLVFYCIQERPILKSGGKIYYGLLPTYILQMRNLGKDIVPTFKCTNQSLVNIISSCLHLDYKMRPNATTLKGWLSDLQ